MKKERMGTVIIKAEVESRKRLMISVPITGLLRAEWAMAKFGQAIPTNWSHQEILQWIDTYAPLGFMVADARNVAVQKFIEGKFDWLFFIDHDVVMPMDTFVTWNQYMLKGDVPIWGGLYFTKSTPSEPLMYREPGRGYFDKWKLGDKVWVGGMGLGCNVIHRALLESIYKDSEDYQIGQLKLRRVFETPQNVTFDAEHNAWLSDGGTEDLHFYKRLKTGGHYKKAGWGKFQEKKYPLLCDTKIFCRHIDWDGTQYPAKGEERQFLK